ncbi:hypothetical protein FLONG3_2527 [Fusarium longipes]|uniref:Uncharacterized protein n=1 Tax=Fusarium longipes TaxID=694270 RepID=A0A395T3L8_9HYPO|nr:hypothetical protein FLONG3_2527 [Fusarium longipes]
MWLFGGKKLVEFSAYRSRPSSREYGQPASVKAKYEYFFLPLTKIFSPLGLRDWQIKAERAEQQSSSISIFSTTLSDILCAHIKMQPPVEAVILAFQEMPPECDRLLPFSRQDCVDREIQTKDGVPHVDG